MQGTLALIGDHAPTIAFCKVVGWWYFCRVNARTGKVIRCLPGARYC